MVMKRVVGVDVSNDTLDAVYSEGDRVFHREFSNSPAGFKELLKWCKARGIEVCFCMEATGAYSIDLAEFLYSQGYTVYVENARLIKAFRESEGERNTTDKQSAAIIARYASSKLERLRKWQPLPDYLKTLRELTRLREALLETKLQWVNRLKSKSVKEFAHYAERTISEIKATIKQVDQQIKMHVEATPRLKRDIKLLRSIQGIGLLTAAVILAEVPWLEYFDDKRDLVAFAGLNPALRQSGTSINFKPRLSKKGSSRIRKALYMPAVVALKRNKRIAEFASRLKDRGKHSMQIVGAAMRRLLCFVFGVLRSGEPFRQEGDVPSRAVAEATLLHSNAA